MKEEYSKNMEDKILEVAKTLFIKQGFDKTTTGQIASIAGCNQALVHYYYRTKDNLFERIIEKRLKDSLPVILLCFEVSGTFEEKINNLINSHFDFLLENFDFIHFVYKEATSDLGRLIKLIGKNVNFPIDIILQLDKELKEEIKKGNILEISVMELLITIATLNGGFFLTLPIIRKILNYSDEQIDVLVKERKKEITQTIFARLKP